MNFCWNWALYSLPYKLNHSVALRRSVFPINQTIMVAIQKEFNIYRNWYLKCNTKLHYALIIRKKVRSLKSEIRVFFLLNIRKYYNFVDTAKTENVSLSLKALYP